MSSVRTDVSCIQLAVTCLQELEYPVVTDEYMFNQLGMVLKVLSEYAERAASKLRASGEHGVLSYGPFNPTTDRPVSVKLHVRCVRQPRCPTSVTAGSRAPPPGE